MVEQAYQSEVNNEYVIRGNSAILKCSIPSFVADFVSVLSWQDDQGNTYNHAISATHYGILVATLFYAVYKLFVIACWKSDMYRARNFMQ